MADKILPISLSLFSANQSGSILTACQKVDNTGQTLGTGQSHIMSQAHLESRDATFNQMHSGLVKYMSSAEERNKTRNQELMTASFHFCNPGRTLLTGTEPIDKTGWFIEMVKIII